MRRISSKNLIHNRTSKGGQLLFHSGVMAEVNFPNEKVTLNVIDFQTPTALDNLNGFLKKWRIDASLFISKGMLFLKRFDKVTLETGNITFGMTENEVANFS